MQRFKNLKSPTKKDVDDFILAENKLNESLNYAIAKYNLFGVQFKPSSKQKIEILRNLINLNKSEIDKISNEDKNNIGFPQKYEDAIILLKQIFTKFLNILNQQTPKKW